MEARSRWTVAAGGALLVVAALALMVRLPPQPVAPTRTARAPVKLARTDAAHRVEVEETMMRDLTPLFLPTDRNVRLAPPLLREPGETVFDLHPFSPDFAEAEPRVVRDLPAVATVNGVPMGSARPVDALRGEGNSALLGFGRREAVINQLPSRGAFIEVVAMATGQRVLGATLPLDGSPSTNQPWIPVEFIATIDAAGLALPLALTAGSRVDEVDAHFKNYLERKYRIGERLPPGFYRITVGP